MILPYDANPGRMEFSERTGKHAATFVAFTHQRHLLRRPHFKELRAGSFRTWARASTAA
jgi:hypothetical protein